MALCPIFGPKLSVFCMLISIWGVIQLALMGVFFYIRSVALIEDIALSEESMKSPQTFLTEVNVRYDNSAKNCFVAACLYVVTMLFSIWQFLANRRVTAQQKSLSTAGAGPFIPESSYQTTRSRREWGTRRLTPSGAAGNTGRRYGGAVLSQLDDDDESPLLKSAGGRSERQPLLSSARNRR